jgi:hypothetical protein
MASPHSGRCLCGNVRYEVRGPLGPLVLCHCAQCRRAQGSAFAANAEVREADFVLLTGAESIKAFESSPGKHRVFCSNCGSPLYSRRSDRPGVFRLRVGTLETRLQGPPTAHIFATSKAPWFEILDNAPQYEGKEPGRDG